MKIQKQIEKYYQQFDVIKRGEEEISILKDDCNKKLHDSVYSAHGDRLPSDWIFDRYQAVLGALRDYTINSIDDVEEYRHEIVDGLVDVYTHDLTKWLNLDNRNVEYLGEVQKEFGVQEDGYKLLAMAQYMAIDEIYGEVVSLLS